MDECVFLGEQNEKKTIFAVLEWILGGFVSDPGVEFLFHDSFMTFGFCQKNTFFLTHVHQFPSIYIFFCQTRKKD